MKSRRIHWAIAGFAGICLQSGAWAQESVIRVGDRLVVEIKGVPLEDRQEVSSIYVVNDAGTIHLPYLDSDPRAAGLTPSGLAKSIEQAYRAAQIYINPTLVVAPQIGDASQLRVIVMGEVKAPNQVPYRPGMTLLEAIAACAGFTDFAKEKEVRLIRNGRTTVHDLTGLSGDPSRDVILNPGDKVLVPERGPFG